jgi:serine/threonine-protein kinase
MPDTITRLNAALEGRYRIERQLGEGGMATVYLADDLKHERQVALKVLKPELAAVVGADRFLAEIKTTANLQHPHILPLHDSGVADSFLFYVMPYVQGETLRDRLEREKQLPVDEAVRMAIDVAEALHAAHQQGVIHRDVKPANILLSGGRPLVADFGIALAVSAAGGGRLTETGLSMGTPYYMSPEQASADRDPSATSDVYSLGCVLYEMLVGEPPYTGGSAQAVLAKILTEDARAATRIRPSIPTNIDGAVRRALEKLPADRFATADAFARALADPGFRYGDAVPAFGGAPVGPWKGLAASFAALFVLAAGVAAWALIRPEPARSVGVGRGARSHSGRVGGGLRRLRAGRGRLSTAVDSPMGEPRACAHCRDGGEGRSRAHRFPRRIGGCLHRRRRHSRGAGPRWPRSHVGDRRALLHHIWVRRGPVRPE